MSTTSNGPSAAFSEAAHALRVDDLPALERVLARQPDVQALLQERSGGFGSPLLLGARSIAALEILLRHGVDLNIRSDWWAGGFGLLDLADPELAEFAVKCGTRVTAHAAARLGWLDVLDGILARDAGAVHERGGDGQTPLHFAANAAVADRLLAAGADIDARDVDHTSTPAQYMLGERNAAAAYLVSRGCQTDILLAAALGDLPLATKHLDADPECVHLRVSDEHFPMAGHGAAGGTIYQWRLGWYVSAAQVAHTRGFSNLYQLLDDRSPGEERLLNACWLHDREAVERLLARDTRAANRLSPAQSQHTAHAARNNDIEALRLMLHAGLPVDTFSQHHATALHWAAWHGNAEAARLILARNPPLTDTSNDYGGSPLDWARHGAENGWDRARGDYPATTEALLAAAALHGAHH